MTVSPGRTGETGTLDDPGEAVPGRSTSRVLARGRLRHDEDGTRQPRTGSGRSAVQAPPTERGRAAEGV